MECESDMRYLVEVMCSFDGIFVEFGVDTVSSRFVGSMVCNTFVVYLAR